MTAERKMSAGVVTILEFLADASPRLGKSTSWTALMFRWGPQCLI